MKEQSPTATEKILIFLVELPIYAAMAFLLFDLMLDKWQERRRDFGTNSS